MQVEQGTEMDQKRGERERERTSCKGEGRFKFRDGLAGSQLQFVLRLLRKVNVKKCTHGSFNTIFQNH
jgi:hypothetical protein